MIPIIQFNTAEGDRLIHHMLSRTQLEFGNVQETVDEIIANIRNKGDEALFEYTEKFDKVRLNNHTLKITQEEIEEAYRLVDDDYIGIIRRATERIRVFHSRQRQNSWFDSSSPGEFLGQLIRPIEKVGIYAPGGKAAYPSSVLMNVVPAQVAGVEKIIMATPVGANGKVYPTTVVAAIEAGVTEIYKIGGAQAVAALAFGTESVPKVDKIVGPGNIYVALAKRSVYGFVNIDSIAGPSEILIIADETANPVFVAADLLSQAEHDELASAILITTSEELAKKVKEELKTQTAALDRKDIIEKSLTSYGAIVVVKNFEEAIALSDKVAPEHLEICTSDPFQFVSKIKNAGAIFLGHYTPEPLGDYMAGPNHVLPTGGTARFFSPLSVDDFIKKSSILSFTKEALESIGPDVVKFAEAEGLTAHGNSVKVRLA